MLTKYLIYISLYVLGSFLIPLFQSKNKSISISDDSANQTIFSRLHTLSIHIKNPAVHDSVFHFLSDKLQLPVYYQPLNIGERKYAGVYAGNLVLEPCGPYPEFNYATNNFKAIFFGLTFEPLKSIPLTGTILQQNEIKHEVGGDEYIFLKDSLLCGENIYVSIMDKHEKEKDHLKMDSLRSVMRKNPKQGIGIEYVKEIKIGYPNKRNLDQWEKLISPSKLNESQVWELNNELNVRFVPGAIREVKAIVFKVRSLEKAKKYLETIKIPFTQNEGEILLNKSETFGLAFFLVE